jgi:hypothetical protein
MRCVAARYQGAGMFGPVIGILFDGFARRIRDELSTLARLEVIDNGKPLPEAE